MMKIMSGNYLFPHFYRRYGLGVLILMLAGGIVLTAFDYELDWMMTVPAIYSDEFMGSENWFSLVRTDFSDEIISLGLIIGAILVAFSKERIEDEFISSIRLRALVWATYVNYGILALSTMFIYGSGFFHIMIYNMFTLLLIFIVKYRWSIYKWKKTNRDEE